MEPLHIDTMRPRDVSHGWVLPGLNNLERRLIVFHQSHRHEPPEKNLPQVHGRKANALNAGVGRNDLGLDRAM